MYELADLDSKELRNFGLIMGSIVAVLFGLFFPWLLEGRLPIWPWIVAAVLSVWSLSAPMSLQPTYRMWMKLGLMLSRITTPIILGIVFCFLILPMGLFMRIFGHDPMARRLDGAAKTYRVTSRKAPRENMERPF